MTDNTITLKLAKEDLTKLFRELVEHTYWDEDDEYWDRFNDIMSRSSSPKDFTELFGELIEENYGDEDIEELWHRFDSIVT